MSAMEEYKEMGRKAFNPNKNPALECPWALWPHTQVMVELWKSGWYEAQEEFISEKRKQEVEIKEVVYLLFDVMEDGCIKFNKCTVDRTLALEVFCNGGRVFILNPSSIRRVVHEKDL